MALAFPNSSAGVSITLTVKPTSSPTFAAAIPALTSHCCNHAVAAGVPDLGETTVFGTNCNVQRAVAGRRKERCGKPADSYLDFETAIGERLGWLATRMPFLL